MVSQESTRKKLEGVWAGAELSRAEPGSWGSDGWKCGLPWWWVSLPLLPWKFADLNAFMLWGAPACRYYLITHRPQGLHSILKNIILLTEKKAHFSIVAFSLLYEIPAKFVLLRANLYSKIFSFSLMLDLSSHLESLGLFLWRLCSCPQLQVTIFLWTRRHPLSSYSRILQISYCTWFLPLCRCRWWQHEMLV